jgi:hypothetical protein
VQRLALPREHWPHAPDGWQAGVEPPHSLSPVQERQVCVAKLHTGVMPPHWAFEVQGTQVAVATSQAGVAPLHLLAFVAEQIPHAPDDWQAGVEAGHSASCAQPRQVWVATLQIGLAPPHWAFEVHETQVPVVV